MDKSDESIENTKLNEIKIIILGQDPYHASGWAHGLSFSSLGEKIPPSLKNIYKCLVKTNVISKYPKSADLTAWAKQGVLLLNTSLTTIVDKAGEHMKIWRPYTEKVITRICEQTQSRLIFMLWGNFAHKFAKIIDNRHLCLTSIHPSPLAQRVSADKKFINCNHFKVANDELKKENKTLINWGAICQGKSEGKSDTKSERKIESKTRKARFDDAETILDIRAEHHIIFTDGSAHPNNKSKSSRAGYACLFASGSYEDKHIYGNLDITKENASNIRAEGMAILCSLKKVLECKDNWEKITVVTDCKFWINMIEEFMPRWDKNKFKTQDNSDLTLEIWVTYNKIKKLGPIKFIHMRSHNKDGWGKFQEGSFERYCYDQNMYVDALCNYARLKLNPGQEIFSSVEY